jgi:hypothetical protein
MIKIQIISITNIAIITANIAMMKVNIAIMTASTWAKKANQKVTNNHGNRNSCKNSTGIKTVTKTKAIKLM